MKRGKSGKNDEKREELKGSWLSLVSGVHSCLRVLRLEPACDRKALKKGLSYVSFFFFLNLKPWINESYLERTHLMKKETAVKVASLFMSVFLCFVCFLFGFLYINDYRRQKAKAKRE